MSSWTEVTLGEIADIQTGPFGSQLHASDYVENGIPCVMPKNIGTRLNFLLDDVARISVGDLLRLKRHSFKVGDIVYSRRGDVEKCAYVDEKSQGWLCGTGCLLVRITSQNVNSKYVAYQLSTPELKGWISGNAVGTTMPNLNTSILQRVPLVLPSIDVQNNTVEILTSLETKVDLLFQQNRTLEQMAETLYRQWFVEGAKEDWPRVSSSDCIRLVGGGTPTTNRSDFWDGSIKWLSAKDVTGAHRQFVSETEKSITDLGLQNSSTRMLPKYATVISARGTVGKYCLLSEPMCFSQSNYGILPADGESYFYTYLMVAEIVEDLQASSYGTVFDTITTRTFNEVQLPRPPGELVKSFEAEISPLIEKMLLNSKQILTLQSTRDILLPKLMSGEVQTKTTVHVKEKQEDMVV